MGRYSDSDDSEQRSGRHSKKKRRSRSRTRSDDSSYSGHSKHKKKKSKRSKRSRSPRRRRSRSKSRSRDRRRRSRSRSESRSRRSRSRSYDRRRRSRSRSRDRRRSASNSRCSPKNESSRSSFKIESDPSSIAGFDMMSPLEQNEVKMQLALKAADLAAEKLKAAGVLESGGGASSATRPEFGLTSDELDKRRKAIENIESENFKQTQFKSSLKTQSQTKKLSARKEMELSHDAAIFGDLLAGTGMDAGAMAKAQTLDIQDPKSLLGPVFFETESVKMARWIDKLKELRRHSHSNGSVS